MQLRRYRWQFWKPKNKVNALSIDWAAYLAAIPAILGILALNGGLWFLSLLLIGASSVVYILLNKRKVIVRSSGKPPAEPPSLIRVDSWQTVVSGGGQDWEEIRQRFIKALSNPPGSNFRCALEKIWNWSLDVKEEREQLVLSLGRGLFFCQIYGYDRELYVGWDAHLNSGRWVEKTLTKGIDKGTGRLASINTAVTGWQRLTEYDVTDLSCLTEWAHTQLVKIIKEYMDEKKIDQEIDFKILRGERQGLTAAGEQTGKGRLKGFVRRVRDSAFGGTAE